MPPLCSLFIVSVTEKVNRLATFKSSLVWGQTATHGEDGQYKDEV